MSGIIGSITNTHSFRMFRVLLFGIVRLSFDGPRIRNHRHFTSCPDDMVGLSIDDGVFLLIVDIDRCHAGFVFKFVNKNNNRDVCYHLK